MGLFDRKPNVAKLAARRDVNGLIKALRDKEEPDRARAAKALGEIGDTRAAEPLTEALKESRDVRKHAAWALDRLGWKPKDKAEEVRHLFAEEKWAELARLGEPAVETLLQAEKDGDPNVSFQASWALQQMRDAKAIEHIIQTLGHHEDAKIRSRAAYVLGGIRDKKAVEPLIQALKDRSWEVRWSASHSLGEIEDPRAVQPLTDALSDGNERVCSEVRFALGILFKQDIERMEKGRDVVGLTEALTSEYPNVPWRAAEALGRIGDERAIEPLVQAMRAQDLNLRKTAEMALGKIKAVCGKMKSRCTQCGQKMMITSEGVFFMGGAEPNIVKLRCEPCDLTRFEKKADIEKELGRTLPPEFTLSPQQY